MTPTDKPGSDGLPNSWLFERLNRLEDLTREQHQRLRSDMQSGFDNWRSEFQRHEEFDYETRRKIERLEVQHENDDKQAMRRSSLYGAIAAAIVASVVEAGKRLFGAQ